MSDELIKYNLDLDYGFFKRKDVRELKFENNYDGTFSECLSELKNLKIENKENYHSISFYSENLIGVGENSKIIMKIVDSSNKQIGIFSHNHKFLNNKLKTNFNKKIFFYGFIESKSLINNQTYSLINSDSNCYWSINL